jgi:hypothetical protein
MTSTRRNVLAASAAAALVVLAALAVSWAIARGDPTLLRDVIVQHGLITPNADGDQDATAIEYTLSRNATVSIYFESVDGVRFYFRREQPRGAGEYEVLFSGVVDGYVLPGEQLEGEVLARLLRNGRYTWTVEAGEPGGDVERASGALAIEQADETLPELRNYSLDKARFSPNQDGIDDRVLIQFFLPKDVTRTRVYLLRPDGAEVPIGELDREVPPGVAGRHYFDYEGGVDNKETPPPDGTYPIVATAEDAEGQKMRVSDELTLEFGGVPRAEIISPVSGDTLELSSTAIALCGTLTFTVTVENYGTTPIRTTGPAPGTVYDSDWNYNTLGWHTESGAWRVAIGYENEISNYPYRWALAGQEQLQKIGEHYYLMPGRRAVVSGSIRIIGPLGERNPQPLWAGLIHEDVEISEFNNRVDPHEVLVDIADVQASGQCEPREIPIRAEE